MIIGTRLKQLREERNLSQSEVERRAGLERCYIERVESGHAVPSLTTLERLAEALELPLYELFYDQDTTAPASEPQRTPVDGRIGWQRTAPKGTPFLPESKALLKQMC